MSRTYRHRHTVPKGYKVVDRDKDIAILDKNGEVTWTQDFSGLYVRWRRYVMKGFWDYGRGHQTNSLEKWKSGWFGKQKIPEYKVAIKHFDGMGRYYGFKEWERFNQKSRRRRENMKVHAWEFDDLPRWTGKSNIPPKGLRKPRKKFRSGDGDYLECVHVRQALPDQAA